MSFEPKLHGIQRGELHAVIGGQPAYVNGGNAAALQIIAQASGFAMAVIEKTAVTVQQRVLAFAEHAFDFRPVEIGVQIGSRRSLHAMYGPEDLGEAGQFDHVTRLLARMIRGETAVIGRMPILRGHDQIELALQIVH